MSPSDTARKLLTRKQKKIKTTKLSSSILPPKGKMPSLLFRIELRQLISRGGFVCVILLLPAHEAKHAQLNQSHDNAHSSSKDGIANDEGQPSRRQLQAPREEVSLLVTRQRIEKGNLQPAIDQQSQPKKSPTPNIRLHQRSAHPPLWILSLSDGCSSLHKLHDPHDQQHKHQSNRNDSYHLVSSPKVLRLRKSKLAPQLR